MSSMLAGTTFSHPVEAEVVADALPETLRLFVENVGSCEIAQSDEHLFLVFHVESAGCSDESAFAGKIETSDVYLFCKAR